MKKVVLASLLAVAGAGPLAHVGFAQDAAAAQAGGQVQMSAEEYAAYNNAGTQTTPAAKAAAFEAYLKAYPNSAVKADVLQQLALAYSGSDVNKALDYADQLVALDPTNFRGFVFDVSLRRAASDAMTDAGAKQAALDKAADASTKGLALAKPKDVSDDDWTKLKSAGYPIFYSAIGTADLNKKDNAGAIAAFKSELGSVPVAQTTAPGLQLQDTFFLAQAYYTSTPPDFVNCTYYATRAMTYAPEPYKTQFSKLAGYCYRKFHGKDEGYEAVVAASKDNLNPPQGFGIAPAPTPESIVSDLIKTTPDLSTLALSDKEYVLQNGKAEDAEKVFATIKGKAVKIPDATVIEATPDSLKVAVSDDAVQGKIADFSFNFKEPLKTVPAVGDKVTISGTYDAYTQSPVMITMVDSDLEVKKVAPKAGAAHRPAPAAHRPAAKK